MYVTKDIEYLARQIVAQKRKYIFWLGAGVSMTAGIPSASGIVDRLLDRLWRSPGASPDERKDIEPLSALPESARAERLGLVRKWAIESVAEVRELSHAMGFLGAAGDGRDWGTLYSTCLSLLPGEEDRQEFIVGCIKEGRGRINVAHLLMSQLMVNDFVRIVLTTNFDDLLLRALHLFFEVPAAVDPDSLDTVITSSAFLQVAYLHGKLSSYRQRYTGREVHESIPHFENFLRTALKDHGLVVAGYRGGDEAPMAILEKVLEERKAGPGRGLFWVSYENDFDKLTDSVRRILQFKDTYWLPGGDADHFFEELCASPGIGLGLLDPSEFAKRLLDSLPEKARTSWSKLQGVGLASGILITESLATSARGEDVNNPASEAASTAPPAELPSQLPLNVFEAETPEVALVLCEEAAAKDPKDSVAFWCWGTALSNLGRNEEALEKFRRATEIDTGYAQAFADWGELLQDIGRDEEAIGKFRRVTEIGSVSARTISLWGVSLQKLGRHQDATELLRRAVEIDPNYAWAFRLWGESLQKLGRQEEAIEKFRRATEIEPSSAWAFALWGRSLQRLGRHEEAVEKFRRATEINPVYAWAFTLWGDSLQDLGRHEEAMERFRRATEINPDSAWTFTLWGRSLHLLSRNEEALEKFKRATEIDPTYSWAFNLWGDSLQDLGRHEEAIDKFRRATEIDPSSAWGLTLLGLSLQKLRRHDEALEQFARAIDANPSYGWAFRLWGQSLQELGRSAEAAEKYQRGTEIEPGNAFGLRQYGGVLQELGRLQEAVDNFRRATEVDPTDEWAFFDWAAALRLLGLDQEAEEKYRRFQELSIKSI